MDELLDFVKEGARCMKIFFGEYEIRFDKAVRYYTRNSRDFDEQSKLRLIGLYKHIRHGPCKPEWYPSPSRWNIIAWKKWNAWHNCKTLTDLDAIDEYCKIVDEVTVKLFKKNIQ